VEIANPLLALGKLCFRYGERSLRSIQPIPHGAERTIHSFPERPLLGSLGGEEVNETGPLILRRRLMSGRVRATIDLTAEPEIKAVIFRVGLDSHAAFIGTRTGANERPWNPSSCELASR
jgi:hypothetical protein